MSVEGQRCEQEPQPGSPERLREKTVNDFFQLMVSLIPLADGVTGNARATIERDVRTLGDLVRSRVKQYPREQGELTRAFNNLAYKDTPLARRAFRALLDGDHRNAPAVRRSIGHPRTLSDQP